MKIHHKNEENVTVKICRLRDHFGVHNRPSLPAIENLIKKLQQTFSLKHERDLCHHWSKRTVENITAATDSVAPRVNISIWYIHRWHFNSVKSNSPYYKMYCKRHACIAKDMPTEQPFSQTIVFRFIQENRFHLFFIPSYNVF